MRDAIEEDGMSMPWRLGSEAEGSIYGRCIDGCDAVMLEQEGCDAEADVSGAEVVKENLSGVELQNKVDNIHYQRNRAVLDAFCCSAFSRHC